MTTASRMRKRLIERLRMTGIRNRPIEEALVIAASVLVAVVIIGCDIGRSGSGGTRTSPQDTDKDGCWQTAPACLSVKIEGDRHGGVRSTITNGCGGRIYVRICNEARRLPGGSSCGSFGIRAGASLSWHTARHADPTGRAYWQWVGSSEPGNDWLCSGVVDGWDGPPAFSLVGDGSSRSGSKSVPAIVD